MSNRCFIGVRLMLILSVGLLFSCKSGVYLDEIDKTAEIDAGVAIPVGRISFPLKTFLSSLQINDNTSIEPNMEEAARLELKYHGEFNRPFTKLGEHFEQSICMSNTTEIKTGLLAITGLQTYPTPLKTSYLHNLLPDVIPNIHIQFSGDGRTLNDDDFRRNFGRIDSILVNEAEFELSVSFKGGLATQTGKINSIKVSSDSISIAVPIEFSADNGTLLFNDDGPMTKILKDFSINLMKNRNIFDSNVRPSLQECSDNANDGLDLNIELYTKAGQQLYVSPDDEILLTFNMRTLSYNTIWGWFANTINNQQQNDTILRLDEALPSGEGMIGWADIKELRLPLAEPSLHLTVGTRVAGPLNLDIDYIKVTDYSTQTTTSAVFDNGLENYIWPIITDNQLNEHYKEYNYRYYSTITFDETNGQLHNLFQARPDEISYSYRVIIDEDSPFYLQQHVMKEDEVGIDIDVTLPFVFNKGVDLQTPDFTFDIAMSAIDIGEAELNFDFEDLSLLLDIENTIPLDVKLVYAFIDEDGNKINFRNLINTASSGDADTITIPAVVDVDANGLPNLSNPSKVTHRIRFSQSEFDRLENVAQMQFYAIIETNENSFNKTDRVVVTQEEGLAVTIKASAALKAVIDFNDITNE